MQDIKTHHIDSHSLSNGQVLPRPYKYDEARNVFLEMVDVLCADMYKKELIAPSFTWWVSYDYKSLEAFPDYDGPVVMDFYGRLHPKHSNGSVKMQERTNSPTLIRPALVSSFDLKTDHRLLYRRLGVCAADVSKDDGFFQLDLFTDYEALEREQRLQGAILEVRSRYGASALFTGKNLKEGATTLERNEQIGGHRR